MSALTLIPGAIQAAIGVVQGIQGLARGKTEAPEYEIPDYINQALGVSKSLAGQTRMPGQDIMEQRIASTAAERASDVMSSAGGSGASLGAMAELGRGTNQAYQDLAVNQAEYNRNNQLQLMNMLGTAAQYEDKAFMMNEWQPYMAQMEASKALKSGGMQNIMGGMQSGISAYETRNMWDEYMDKMFQNQSFNSGGVGTPTTTQPVTQQMSLSPNLTTQSPIGWNIPQTPMDFTPNILENYQPRMNPEFEMLSQKLLPQHSMKNGY